MMAEQAAVYGGHDNDFVGEVADRFICQICTKVLREPHLAVCCGQHFCESCLNKSGSVDNKADKAALTAARRETLSVT